MTSRAAPGISPGQHEQKNIARYHAHIIDSWPNCEQWLVNHILHLVMMKYNYSYNHQKSNWWAENTTALYITQQMMEIIYSFFYDGRYSSSYVQNTAAWKMIRHSELGRSKNATKLRVTSQWPADSLHKGPITRKKSLFDDVIVCWSLRA